MNRIIILLAIALIAFASCEKPKKAQVIAISKAKPLEFYGNYSEWLHRSDSNVVFINMYELGVDSALKVLDSCDGLIVTGGADVYPGWYGKLQDTILCGEFDRYRDTLEISLIEKAIADKMPILGICRGEQIINVTLGGSLIVDIPTIKGTQIQHRQEDWENCFHQVNIEQGSLLSAISGSTSGKVNSNHHQSIDEISPKLQVVAWSADSIVEAVEWLNPEGNGFLMAVQWHPERLDTVNASLSTPIMDKFLEEAFRFRNPK